MKSKIMNNNKDTIKKYNCSKINAFQKSNNYLVSTQQIIITSQPLSTTIKCHQSQGDQQKNSNEISSLIENSLQYPHKEAELLQVQTQLQDNFEQDINGVNTLYDQMATSDDDQVNGDQEKIKEIENQLQEKQNKILQVKRSLIQYDEEQTYQPLFNQNIPRTDLKISSTILISVRQCSENENAELSKKLKNNLLPIEQQKNQINASNLDQKNLDEGNNKINENLTLNDDKKELENIILNHNSINTNFKNKEQQPADVSLTLSNQDTINGYNVQQTIKMKENIDTNIVSNTQRSFEVIEIGDFSISDLNENIDEETEKQQATQQCTDSQNIQIQTINENEEVIRDLAIIENEFTQILKNLNQKNNLSAKFKKYFDKIIIVLKENDYSIEGFLYSTENMDIFEGKYKLTQILLKIFYNIEKSDVRQLLIQSQSQSEGEVVNRLSIQDDIHILVLNQNDTEMQQIYSLLQLNKVKYWGIEEFNLKNSDLNEGKGMHEKIKLFLEHQELIIEKLKNKYYFLSSFSAEREEALEFKGFQQYLNYSCQEIVLKILFGVKKVDIEEVIKMMNLLQKNTNVVKLLDHVEISSDIYALVQEKFSYNLSDELEKLEDREICFTPQRLQHMLIDILDGLVQYSAYKSIHLDIKPENILVDFDNTGYYIDFGLSVFPQNDNNYLAIQEYNQESAFPKQISQKTDIYSLGKTLKKVLLVYKQIQQNEDISLLEDIIAKNMIEKKEYYQKDCIDIHRLFYNYLRETYQKQFLDFYSQKIITILKQQDQSCDNECNINVQYQLELLIYYNQINLEIHSIIFDNPGYADIAQSLNDIASCFERLGLFKNSFNYKLKSLEIINQMFKGYHFYIATSYNDLGSFYNKFEDYQIALKYSGESLEMRKKLFKGNHPNIADSLHDIARSYYGLGDFQNTLKYSLESLKMKQMLFLGNHHSILESLMAVTFSYLNLGNSKKALLFSLKYEKMKKQLLTNDLSLRDFQVNNGCQIEIENDKIQLKCILPSRQDKESSVNNQIQCFNQIEEDKKSLQILPYNQNINRNQNITLLNPEITPSLENQGKTLKKSLKNQICSYARKNNIQELKYVVLNSQQYQYALITYQEYPLSLKNGQTIKCLLSREQDNLEEDLQIGDGQTQRYKAIIIRDNGHIYENHNEFSNMLNVQNIMLEQRNEENKEEQQSTYRKQFKKLKQKHNLFETDQPTFETEYTKCLDEYLFSQDQKIEDNNIQSSLSKGEEASKEGIFDNQQMNNNFQFIENTEVQYLIDDPFYAFNTIDSQLSSSKYQEEKINQNYEEQIAIENKQLIQINQHKDNFENILLNYELSSNFKENVNSIQEKLQYTACFLTKPFEQTEKFDLFEGKLYQFDIIHKIYYQAIEEDIKKEILTLKEIEKEDAVGELFLYHYIIEDTKNIHILVLVKENYLKIKEKIEYLKTKDIRIWDLKQFNKQNEEKFKNLSENKKIQQFQIVKNAIIDRLQQSNYYLSQYLTQGGEGIIFEGYYQKSIGEYHDVIFKIIFDTNSEEIQEEVEIMSIFEKKINIIKLYNCFEIEEEIYILVLEKCKYSLLDELNMMKSNEILFTQQKLFQIILDLLDGLIQLRIYKILHLDIKPMNILLNSDDQYVFTDFGISSFKNEKNKIIKVKGYSQFYAPQEQMKEIHNSQVNFQSDVYSLGKMFELVIQSYMKIQQDSSIAQKLKEIVEQYMLRSKIDDRQDCLSLHKLFFSCLIKTNCLSFLEVYQKKITSILELQTFENKKDIPTFLELKLYYQQISLEITQNYLPNPQQSAIAESNNNVGTSYLDLGQIKKALRYFLISLELTKKNSEHKNIDIAKFLNNIGVAYGDLGDNQNALKYSLKTLEKYQYIFKGNYPYIATSLNNIGVAYLGLGDNLNAQQYMLDSLKMIKQLFKGDNLQIASFLNNIGSSYYDIGDNENALKYYQQSIEISRRLFKGVHPQTAISLNNIGRCYENLGNYSSAFFCEQESLEMFREIFVEDHPYIATSLNNISVWHESLGSYKKALKFGFQSLETRRKMFEGDHPDIASSLNNLGILHYKLSSYKQALKFLSQSLEIYKIMFKEDHPDKAISLNNIGSFYRDLGDYENSLEYLQKSLEMKKIIFKGDHLQIAISLNNIGMIYADLGDSQQALKLLQQSLVMKQKFLKGDHPSIAVSLNNIGGLYQFFKDEQNSLKYYSQAHEMIRKFYKTDHPVIATLLNNISSCYTNLGDYQMALNYAKGSLEMRKNIFFGNHPDIAQSLNNVGNCYRDLKLYKDALNYMKESLEMRISIFKQIHPDITISLNNIGCIYGDLGQHKNALQCHLLSLQMRRQIIEKPNSDLALILSNVGNCYIDLGDYQRALIYQIECLEIRRNIYSVNHREIQKLLQNIFINYKKIGDYAMSLKYFLEYLESK